MLNPNQTMDAFDQADSYIAELKARIVELEAENANIKRERDEYLDLLDETFNYFSGHQQNESIDDDGIKHYTETGWLDDNASSTLRSIGDALVKAGRLERHPENKRLYRRTK